jgi:hypothetical protein
MKTLCLIAILLVAANSARAQYSVPWSKFAGGGATTPSTGSVYAVSGTLGQHDASGAMTNGQYSVTGGFWSGVNLLQTPGAPLLAAEQLGGGNVRVFWPLPATGFVLDQSLTVTGTWSQVAFPYATNATHISITVPAVGDRFYRLRKP